MFIHAVETPRKTKVTFGIPSLGRKNEISLLTGPNGSGKTDVLASIAEVFHGDKRYSSGATVTWSKGSNFHTTLMPLYEHQGYGDYERLRLIAQTFSPFSRFPVPHRSTPPSLAPTYSRGEVSAEEYTCIGFNKKSSIRLDKLSFSIVENAILRLSDRPKTAKVAFDVLDELGFKQGVTISYRAKRYFSAIATAARDSTTLDRLENELAVLGRTGGLPAANNQGKKILQRLRREIRASSAEETAEYLRHALNMIEEYSTGNQPSRGGHLETFNFSAFKDRHSMSLDFPYLQAFSYLARLDLLEVDGCELTPIAGRPLDLTRTSSGQQQMLCSTFGLAAALDDDSVVLIDEPELSLHPRWQMNFFKHLETALEEVSACHVILATHSPLIAQAAAAHGVQIVSMGVESSPQDSAATTRREASSVEEMLVDVFDTPIPNSLHISKEIFGLITKVESGSVWDKLQAVDQLSNYLSLYRRQGEGSADTARLLEKALDLVSTAVPRG